MSDSPQPITQLTPQQRYDQALAALTARQRAFVAAYLDCLNATEAARRAKYSKKTARQIATENLSKPAIAEAIAAGLALQAMSSEEILARLSAQARGSMADFLRVDEEDVQVSWSILDLPRNRDGNPDLPGAVYDLAQQKLVGPTERVLHTAIVKRSVARLDLLAAGEAGRLALIKKYAIDGEKVSIELYSAKDALELLGKHRRLWGDDAGAVLKHLDLSRLSPEQLERLSAGDDPYDVLLGQ